MTVEHNTTTKIVVLNISVWYGENVINGFVIFKKKNKFKSLFMMCQLLLQQQTTFSLKQLLIS